MRVSARAQRIEPFYVMEVAKAAQTLAHAVAGSAEPMIFLNIGEPDFTAPPRVQEAAVRAIADGSTQYTQALGMPALRERISGWYAERFGVQVPARRIAEALVGELRTRPVDVVHPRSCAASTAWCRRTAASR